MNDTVAVGSESQHVATTGAPGAPRWRRRLPVEVRAQASLTSAQHRSLRVGTVSARPPKAVRPQKAAAAAAPALSNWRRLLLLGSVSILSPHCARSRRDGCRSSPRSWGRPIESSPLAPPATGAAVPLIFCSSGGIRARRGWLTSGPPSAPEFASTSPVARPVVRRRLEQIAQAVEYDRAAVSAGAVVRYVQVGDAWILPGHRSGRVGPSRDMSGPRNVRWWSTRYTTTYQRNTTCHEDRPSPLLRRIPRCGVVSATREWIPALNTAALLVS